MKLGSRLFYSYLIFILLYAGFVLLPAPQQAILLQYHLTVTELRVIDVSIICLMAIIWFAGFYGYAKLNSYTSLIRKEKDGKQVAKLTRGVFFLVLWLPVSSVVSAILNLIAVKHTGALPAVTVINHYLSLALPFAGFIYISRGAHGLSGLLKQRPDYRIVHLLVLLVIYLGLIYFHLVVATDQRATVYHLSLWGILLTLAAPYIYMWFMGLISAYHIYSYKQKVTGIVYRKGWTLLALGLTWLIIMSMGFQYLNTLTVRLQHLSIYALLAIVYSLLLVMAVGFVLIALGARKLQRIEEV